MSIDCYIQVNEAFFLDCHGNKLTSCFALACCIHPFCSLKEELNGVDFNWEAPRSYEEHEAYTQLLIKAGSVFHDANLLISASLRSLPHPDAAKSLDRILVNAYNLGADKYHADYNEVVHMAGQFLSHYPSDKLVLGIPAYAQHFPSGITDKSFSQIMDGVLMVEDDPEAVNEMESFNRYRFDSPKAVRRKVEYARSKHLKGVFLWELGQDKQLEGVAPGGMLLEAAYKQANSKDGIGSTNSDEL